MFLIVEHGEFKSNTMPVLWASIHYEEIPFTVTIEVGNCFFVLALISAWLPRNPDF